MGAVGSALPDRVLLDTHVLLWWLFDDPRLSKRARDVIRSADTAVLVSSASGWEIGTKHRLERLPIVTNDPVFARYAVDVVW